MAVSASASTNGSNDTGNKTVLSPEVFLTNNFWVEIEGMLEACFVECSGMQATTEYYEYKEGGLNSHTHKLPVRTSFANITLKRGLTTSDALWKWYEGTVKGKVERKNVSIILYSRLKPGEVVQRWEISRAYPVKWIGPNFNSRSSEFTIESVELAYDSFTKAAS